MTPNILVADRIITIEGFFWLEKCASYIAESEDNGYDAASITTRHGQVMNTEVRNNHRVIFDSPQLADQLWPRPRSFVPSPLWNREAIGLNQRFRFYRYDAGQTFKPHYDGSFRRDNGEKSQVTFMIYLNEEFNGGETKFDLRYPHGAMSVRPQTGMALLFVHNLRHEGAPVATGRKYVLRTDVMYSPLPKGVEESTD